MNEFTPQDEEEAKKMAPQGDPTDSPEYDQAFEDATDEKPQVSDYAAYQLPIGTHLLGLFGEAERDRRSIEERWMRDLRQYKAEYDPEVKARLHPKRSQANLSLTRTKVKTVDARMMEIFFPAGSAKPWGIEPTSVPELHPQLLTQIKSQMAEITGQEPSIKEVEKVIFEEAQARSEDMEHEMADQLEEIQYRDIIRQVIHSGNLYGTGILKGPLVRENISRRFLRDGNEWGQIKITNYRPYAEFCPIWSFYPDMNATRLEDCRYVFQRHVMARHNVFKLSRRDDFLAEPILAYIKANPDGDADLKTFENSLHDTKSKGDDGASGATRTGMYQVLEFWGYLSVDELKDLEIEVPEDTLGSELAVNIWMLNDVVIKAVISPVDGVEIPFQLYYFSKDETSIFGEGIAVLMRDVQGLFNATVRAMLDNAALSAGPIIEANMDLLAAEEDPTDLFPFRVFQRTGMGSDAMAKAITVTTLPTYTSEFMALIQFLETTADNITAIPRYSYGETGAVSGTAAQTATGLSMLMGAAHISLKDQVKAFDDGITTPFIKALYYWNMSFNERDEIKGDFQIVARGTATLMAREVQGEQLAKVMQLVQSPMFEPYTNPERLLAAVVKNLDLENLGIVKTPQQTQIEDEQRAKAAEENEKFEQNLAMIKATSGGHMEPEQGSPEGEQMEVNMPSEQQLAMGQSPEVALEP